MDNLPNLSTICQCLRYLEFEEYRSIFHDHRAKKLFAGNTIQLHIVGQLLGLGDYQMISEQLHAHESLRQLTGLEQISASALSRKTATLCTYSLQALFAQLVGRIEALQQGKGLERLGRLCVIDATELKLPLNLAQWASCSASKQGVKMHTRVVVVEPQLVYPDRIIASTADVNETEVSLALVTDPDAIHVMDRGYQKHKHFESWTKQNLSFVCRIRDNTRYIVTRDFRVPKTDRSSIISDRKVFIEKCEKPLRLVIVRDEQQREYYIVTNRFDLGAADIAQVYKYRWLVELFFKWIKQHLRYIKVFSYSPEGVWNQMYLALIAFAICTLIQLETKTRHTVWDILKRIRVYGYELWFDFLQSLERRPTRGSRGRQRTAKPPDRPKVQKKLVLI